MSSDQPNSHELRAEYEYDVALSFLSQDEATAQELADKISDQLKVFIYSRQQEKLAGRDGEEKFNAVFGQDARVVVVFSRDGWGDTPFTRIEQTAIRNRAFEEGYDFTLFVPTTNPPCLPKYVPKNRLYGNLARFGLNGLAAAIEQLARERGGQPRTETIEDRSARNQRILDYERRRRKFLTSEEGGRIAISEAARITDLVHEWAISEPARHLGLNVRGEQGMARLVYHILPTGAYVSATLGFRLQYTNELADARLEFATYHGLPQWRGIVSWGEADKVSETKYRCDLAADNTVIWIPEDDEVPRLSAVDSAEQLCTRIMDWIETASRYEKTPNRR
jgi:hypothetical protein